MKSFTNKIIYTNTRFMKDVKKTFQLLDGNEFCNGLKTIYGEIKDYHPKNYYYDYTVLDTINKAMCQSHASGVISQGISQILYYIYQTISILPLNHIKNLNTTEVIDCVNITTIYLTHSIEGLLTIIKRNINREFDIMLTFLIMFFAFYMFLTIIVHLIFWTCFFGLIQSEIIKSRGMLKLLPIELIKKLKAINQNTQDKAINSSLQFFKQMNISL